MKLSLSALKRKKNNKPLPLYKYPRGSLNSVTQTYFPLPEEISVTWDNAAGV